MRSFLNNIIRTAGILFLSLFIFGQLFAQDRNEEVTIIAPYEPKIMDPSKPAFYPDYPEIEKSTFEYDYDFVDRKVSTAIDLTPVQPKRPSGDPRKELYRNYLKAGIGTYLNPYLLFTANTLQSDKRSIGFRIEHQSALRDIKGYSPSTYSKSNINLSATRHFKKSSFGASLFYDHHLVHQYGFQPDSLVPFDSDAKGNRQIFQTFGLKLTFLDAPAARDKFNYGIVLKPYYIKDSYESNEVGIDANVDLNFTGSIFSLGDSETLGMPLTLTFQNFNDSIRSQTNVLAGFHPFYEFIYEQYSLKVGLRTYYARDTASKFHVYPYVLGKVSVVDNRLSFYAGIRGQIRNNSFREHSGINPFISSVQELLNTNEKFEIFGGLNASAGIFSFFAEVSGVTFKNMPFYVTDTSTFYDNQFLIIYDNGQKIRFTLGSEVNILNKLMVRLKGNFNFYTLDNEEKPWQIPKIDILLEARYRVIEKLVLSTELYFIGERFAKNSDDLTAPFIMDSFIDVNLGAEYFISDQFSAFISFKNLANKSYQHWHNYPVQGIQAIGGITFSF